MSIFIDLSGQKYGRLTAVNRADNHGRRTFWDCLCDCGALCVVGAEAIRRGSTKSCGCIHAEMLERTFVKHGHGRSGAARSREYSIYRNVIKRCYSPKATNYKYYGGRGIKVCERWLGECGFQNFLADTGKCPSPTHSLDRYPDNNGNYEPGNVRWATPKQQANNRRKHATEQNSH